MKTYRAMLAEIERLQRKAEARRRVEIKGVVKHIRELISEHGLTSHDLGLDGAKPPRPFQEPKAAPPVRGRKAGKAGKAPKASASKGVPRYRDPATGKTWTGRGKPPNWIVGAKDRTPFEIGAGAADAAPAQAAKAAKSTRAAKAVKAQRAPKAAARKPRAAQAAQPTAKKAAAKRAALAAAKPGKAVKGPKAAKLPKPPVPKAAGKRAKAPKVAAPAPAPMEAGAAAPAPGA